MRWRTDSSLIECHSFKCLTKTHICPAGAASYFFNSNTKKIHLISTTSLSFLLLLPRSVFSLNVLHFLTFLFPFNPIYLSSFSEMKVQRSRERKCAASIYFLKHSSLNQCHTRPPQLMADRLQSCVSVCKIPHGYMQWEFPSACMTAWNTVLTIHFPLFWKIMVLYHSKWSRLALWTWFFNETKVDTGLFLDEAYLYLWTQACVLFQSFFSGAAQVITHSTIFCV